MSLHPTDSLSSPMRDRALSVADDGAPDESSPKAVAWELESAELSIGSYNPFSVLDNDDMEELQSPASLNNDYKDDDDREETETSRTIGAGDEEEITSAHEAFSPVEHNEIMAKVSGLECKIDPELKKVNSRHVHIEDRIDGSGSYVNLQAIKGNTRSSNRSPGEEDEIVLRGNQKILETSLSTDVGEEACQMSSTGQSLNITVVESVVDEHQQVDRLETSKPAPTRAEGAYPRAKDMFYRAKHHHKDEHCATQRQLKSFWFSYCIFCH